MLQRLELTFPHFDTDLSLQTHIEKMTMLPEFWTAARTSEFITDLEYLFSRLNLGSFASTTPHAGLMSKIAPKTWDDCRSNIDGKRRTHNYDSFVKLLLELVFERVNDAHMNEYFRINLGTNPPPPQRMINGDVVRAMKALRLFAPWKVCLVLMGVRSLPCCNVGR